MARDHRGGRDHRRRWQVAAAVLAFAILPLSLFAADPTPTPRAPVKLSTWTRAEYLAREGKDRTPVFGARLQISVQISRFTLAARLDASAQKDGVSLENPDTHDTAEVYALAAVDVVGPVAIAGLWGSSRPTMGQEGPEQQTVGAGLLIGDGTGELWALLMVGKHEPSGEGLRPLFAVQAPLRDRTSVVANGALGRGWSVRAGIAVRIR